MTQAASMEEIRTWGATVSVPVACRAIGISTSQGYALAGRGEFPTRLIKVGSMYRVVTASLIKLLGDEAA